ncbi:major facilitator superfamily domain-containing protein 6-like protein A [Argiope bruennichi]|uniref:major facilitator superfamily domain-containing protein 6-like protein A n=1 Tax=Argiope bruennichi TaxID=94029 RepID=UPI002495338F|nr:major facilitator superfamily domain-containing protein 6-like protein A [Argiope bruennichi]XP_055935317.1 major facilitator superfamily domain-containing protein 6-like protein A [Argiope bruennichi]
MAQKLESKDSSEILTKSDSSSKECRVHFNIYKGFKIVICKPLVPLKLTVLFWFTGSYGLITYLTLLFKQRGLTLEEISLMYLLVSVTQLICNTLCGIMSDKIGRPSIISVITLVSTAIVALCLAFIPGVTKPTVISDLHCGKTSLLQIESNQICEATDSLQACRKICTKSDEFQCCDQNLVHKILLNGTNNHSEFSFDWCLQNSTVVLIANDTHSLCDMYYKKACGSFCTEKRQGNSERTKIVILHVILAIMLLTAIENIFRFVDILMVSMAKSHQAEYGKQQFWSIVGTLIGPSSAAYVIHMTTVSEETPNYTSCLFLFAILAVITIGIVCTLKARRQEPAKNMWKASMTLLTDLDFLFFTFVLLVLGGTFGFQLNFKNVYMSDIGTPTYLIGLMDTFAGLCGLPVLFTSKWLTQKIGNTNIFILALLGYALKCLGYSFLKVPWPAFFLETITALSYHLLWVAVMNFCAEISPHDIKDSVVVFAGTLHFSIGVACGSTIGGLLMGSYGGSFAFRVIAAVDFVAAIIYSIFIYSKRLKSKKILEIS